MPMTVEGISAMFEGIKGTDHEAILSHAFGDIYFQHANDY
jgi:hypothetical protein